MRIQMTRMRIGSLAALFALCACLALSASAFAQSAAQAYGGTLGEEQTGLQGDVRDRGGSGGADGVGGAGQGTQAGKADGGGLPFTGLQLGLVALAGAGLLGTGFVIRRASVHPA